MYKQHAVQLHGSVHGMVLTITVTYQYNLTSQVHLQHIYVHIVST